MRRVMISCSHVQRPLARQLHDLLITAGCNPKLDQIDIGEGERWRQTIAWWLSACQVAVVLLSEEALSSAWVRYELSVLSSREQLGNMRLVLVFVGVSADEVCFRPELEPMQLAELQTSHELAHDKPDEEELWAVVRSVQADSAIAEPPVEQIVAQVTDEIRDVATDRVAAARTDLAGPAGDPWLVELGDVQREFAEAYCATPLESTYPSLQTLAQDRHLQTGDLHVLVDLNVMTTFDFRLIDRIGEAGVAGVAGELSGARRSLVTSITRADLAEVATDTMRFRTSMYPYRFVVHGPVTGETADDVATGLAAELRVAISEQAEENETAEDFLAAVARRRHPVFALLASAAGITSDVLEALEQSFPTVVFVVLSTPRRTMVSLASDLGIEGVGADLDESVWPRHVRHELELAAERLALRDDLHRLKRAIQR